MAAIDSFLSDPERWQASVGPSIEPQQPEIAANEDASESLTERPQRWDVPFGETMDDDAVNALLHVAPFSEMDEGRFSNAIPLRKILLNDTRLVMYKGGDVIVREGDYGNSAFLVLSGKVRVTLDSLPKSLLGQERRSQKNPIQAIAQLWNNSKHRESRSKARVASSGAMGVRQVDGASRIFLQDIPGILDKYRSLELNVGEFFGELAALSRTARSATVLAVDESLLLEIRWQGLRDIMRWDPALQQQIHTLYRQNSLETHLRETPYFQHLSTDDIRLVANETVFESHGNFEWNRRFRKIANEDPKKQILDEPMIGEEGTYIDGVLLLRNGFARLSKRWGDGHRTLSYLGKGQAYGLAELVYSSVKKEEIPLQYSLRALGYVDTLRIPSRIVQDLIIPSLPAGTVKRLVKQIEDELNRSKSSEGKFEAEADEQLNAGFMEFISENRLMNGKKAMLIDLDRCIRCDDCVRACASTHDNNPRFVRQGVRYGSFQFANACMHCVDPVCLIGCPTGAIAREPRQGNVLINDETCVGCRTCAESCPYQNIQMVEITDADGRPFFDQETKLPILKATKCDLCETQLGGPACQRACSHDALIRIDMSDTKALDAWISR